jgi:ADP-ribose pyrophosphatase YjhB (NUDIX family)
MTSREGTEEAQLEVKRWDGPRVNATVDVVPYNRATKRVLLGRKKTDPENTWRCIGGFADPELDESYVDTALRELNEEVISPVLNKLSVNHRLTYLASCKIPDPRLRDTADSIITTLFLLSINEVTDPPCYAGDDLSEVSWFDLYDFVPRLVPQHREIGIKVYKCITGI